MRDYYDILGVSKSASADEIKAAFRKLAHKHHPDKSGGDAEKFKEINNAYQTLSDTAKRQKYDQFGSQYEQMGQGGGPGGFDFSGFGSGANGFSFDFGDLADMMGGAFGGGRRQRGPASGQDIHADLQLTFRDAVFGAQKTVTMRRNVTCDHCDGSGAEKGSKLADCDKCKGSGEVRRVQQTILGAMQVAATCDKCAGRGKMPEKKCGVCSGSGIVRGSRELAVRVPAGIDDGETLRLSGEGEAAPHGGRSGDLYVTVRVKADPKFRREGTDLHMDADVSFAQAALGATLSVETVDGPVDLKIPAGTQPGTVFRLKGKGVPSLRGGNRGDQFVTARVQVPGKLTKGQREALEGWEKL
jgi:molecular chaperone DnaJ